MKAATEQTKREAGPKTREQLDRIAGASNAPDVVLPCALAVVHDLDGKPVERGTYTLADEDRPTAAALVGPCRMGQGGQA